MADFDANDTAYELTSKIMEKLGELHLKKTIGIQTSYETVDPRSEIHSAIVHYFLDGVACGGCAHGIWEHRDEEKPDSESDACSCGCITTQQQLRGN